MRFNPATETQAFSDVNAAAIDLTNFPELKSNSLVWDCQTGKWALNQDLMKLIETPALVTV
jgi:hypothetical protein